MWKAVEAEDVGGELGGDVAGGVGVFGGDEVGLFGEAVDGDKDSIVSFRWGEVDDVVDGDGMPGSWGNRERGKEAIGFVVWWFSSLAGLAGAYVVIDEVAHLWPVEVAGDGFQRLGLAKMTGRTSIVGFA